VAEGRALTLMSYREKKGLEEAKKAGAISLTFTFKVLKHVTQQFQF
jgi:hypothetical protein